MDGGVCSCLEVALAFRKRTHTQHANTFLQQSSSTAQHAPWPSTRHTTKPQAPPHAAPPAQHWQADHPGLRHPVLMARSTHLARVGMQHTILLALLVDHKCVILKHGGEAVVLEGSGLRLLLALGVRRVASGIDAVCGGLCLLQKDACCQLGIDLCRDRG